MIYLIVIEDNPILNRPVVVFKIKIEINRPVFVFKSKEKQELKEKKKKTKKKIIGIFCLIHKC